MTRADVSPLVRVRAALAGSTARRVIVDRADLIAALADATGVDVPEQAGAVTLTAADADRLAAAAWDTADGEDQRRTRYGEWSSDAIPEHIRDDQLRAARRTIHHMIRERGSG